MAAIFSKSFFRAFRGAFRHQQGGSGGPASSGPNRGSRPRPTSRHMSTAGAYAGNFEGLLFRTRGLHFRTLGTGALLGGGAVAYKNAAEDDGQTYAGEKQTSDIEWVNALATREGVEEVLCPGQMLRKHPVGKLMGAEDDHLFSTMFQAEQLRELRCFYDASKRSYYTVVRLGTDVCGYPATVHGGLTAAIVDETFGGLYTCLLTSGALGAQLPALTARLEVDYKAKIAAGSVLLFATELEKVEGRKIWMRARVSDGAGTTYATARALFVAPQPQKTVQRALFGWMSRQ